MKLAISFKGLFINIIFLFFFYTINPDFEISSFLKALFFIFLSYLSGNLLLGHTRLISRYSQMAGTGLSIFIGGTLLWFIWRLIYELNINSNYLFLIYFVFIYFVFRKNFQFTRTKIVLYEILSYIILFVFIFYGRNIFETLSNVPIKAGNFVDNFFYTSLVVSLKTTGINSAFFDVGAPIKYHIGGFFFPAVLSAISGINAHISTWVIFVPFIRFLSLLVMSETIAIILTNYFSLKNKPFALLSLMGLILYLFTFSLNPKYLLSLNVEKFLWIGTPVTIPDMPALATGFLMSFWSVALYFDKKLLQTKTGSIAFILISSSIIVFKSTFYFIFLSFTGLFALWDFFYNKKRNNIILIILSFSLAIIWYYIFFTGGDTLIFKIKPFFLSEYFVKKSIFIGTLISLFVILIIWPGIKLLLILTAFTNNRFRNQKNLVFFTITFLTLIFSTIPSFLFRIYNIDGNREVWANMSYDLIQFIKAGITFFNFGAIILLLSFIFSTYSKQLKKIMLIALFMYGLLVATSMLYYNINMYKTLKFSPPKWETKVINTINENKLNGLFAVRASNKYSGQFIAANEVGPWYTCVIKKTGGVSLNSKNWYRYKLLLKLENDTISLQEKEEIIKIFKTNGVTYLIATPENNKYYKELSNNKILKQNIRSKWIYEIP